LTCVFRPVSVLISQRQALSLSGWKSALLDTPLTQAPPEASATISLTCPSRVGLCWRERSHPPRPHRGGAVGLLVPWQVASGSARVQVAGQCFTHEHAGAHAAGLGFGLEDVIHGLRDGDVDAR